MCKPVEFLVRNAKGLYILGGIIVALAGWFFMVNGIPARLDKDEARVEQLERDVAELKTGIAEQNAKLTIIIDSVYQIRNVLLSK